MAKIKYLMIRINCLYAISGIYKNKYTYNNCVSESINDRFLNNSRILNAFEYMPIFFQADSTHKNNYIELVTRRKFFIRNCPNLESRIEAVDGSCCSKNVVFISNDYGIDDYKEIIAFFEKLKSKNMCESYFEKVWEIFGHIDLCKEDALNGNGRVEDSVDATDYFDGIGYDANLILSAKNGKKRKK